MSANCLFCQIANREIPVTILDETPECVAFRDVNPAGPVHILVVPKKHIPSLVEVDDPALLGEILDLARRLAEREGVAKSGYRVVLNTNPDGGQSVFHLHAHLIGGRKMAWPPG